MSRWCRNHTQTRTHTHRQLIQCCDNCDCRIICGVTRVSLMWVFVLHYTCPVTGRRNFAMRCCLAAMPQTFLFLSGFQVSLLQWDVCIEKGCSRWNGKKSKLQGIRGGWWSLCNSIALKNKFFKTQYFSLRAQFWLLIIKVKLSILSMCSTKSLVFTGHLICTAN